MRFKEYYLSNIFAIEKYSASLLNKGLTSVTGYSHDDKNENGAGKSSITGKGIFWILFGRTPLGTKYDKVINRRNQKQPAEGWITFETEHLERGEFKILRTRNPNKLFLFRAQDNGWVDISDKDSASTQAKINTLLESSFETYIQTNFFGQGRLTGYPELPPSQRKQVLSEILPFELISQYIENTTSALKQLEEVEDAILKDELKLKGAVQALERAVLIEEEKDVLFTKWLNLQLPRSFVYSEAKHQSLMVCLNTVSKELEQIKIRLNQIAGNLSQLLKKNIDTCPTCSRKLDSDSIEHVKSEIKKLEEEQITLVSLQSNNIKTKVHLENELIPFESWVKKEQIKNSPTPYKTNEISIQLKSAYHELSLLNARKDELNKKMTLVETWLNIYKKDLPLYMFAVACPILNERIRFHLDELKLPQFHVECSTIKELTSGEIREEFELKVWSDHGGDGFDSLSGGEQQMINFACTMALSDLSEYFGKSVSNVLILDEPFTMLSPKNCEAIVNYLTGYLTKKKDTIFLITNDNHLQTLVPNSIFVEKQDGITFVKEKETI